MSLPSTGGVVGKKGGPSYGQMIDFGVVQAGLGELNPEITLDAHVRRPSDYKLLLQGGPNDYSGTRTGVYYTGNFICSIDRGLIPEFKLWEETMGVEEISMADIERYDNTRVAFAEILEGSEQYHAALSLAEKGDDNYGIFNGKVYRYQPFRETKVLGRVLRVGWRHTFEAIIRTKIPGVTRSSISEKFGVDMSKYPIGPPEELKRLLFEE